MLGPKTFYEHMLFETVRIETQLSNGDTGIGTGFIFGHTSREGNRLFLITNKHVVKDSILGQLVFKRQVEEESYLGHPIYIEFDDFEKLWIPHPEDNIDIAILPISFIINTLEENGIKLHFSYINQHHIPTEEQIQQELDAVEDIIFVGYPTGIYDEKHITPIFRKGITATPIFLDYNGEPAFLIDASVFPGSSGSPVFIVNSGIVSPKRKILQDRIKKLGALFIGILAKSKIDPVRSPLEMIDIPIDLKFGVTIGQYIDIGKVYRSTLILEMIENILKQKGILT